MDTALKDLWSEGRYKLNKKDIKINVALLSIMKENTDNKMAKITPKYGKERTAVWGPRERTLNIFWNMKNKDDIQKKVTTKSRN